MTIMLNSKAAIADLEQESHGLMIKAATCSKKKSLCTKREVGDTGGGQRDEHEERSLKPERNQRTSNRTTAKEPWKCEKKEMVANQI